MFKKKKKKKKKIIIIIIQSQFSKNAFLFQDGLDGVVDKREAQLSQTGSSKASGRELKSCLGRVFNFKLGHFVMHAIAWHIQENQSLKLKTKLLLAYVCP